MAILEAAPRRKKLSETLGENISQGLVSGYASGREQANEESLLQKKYQLQQGLQNQKELLRAKNLASLSGNLQREQPSFSDKLQNNISPQREDLFNNLAQAAQDDLGRDLEPQELNDIWNMTGQIEKESMKNKQQEPSYLYDKAQQAYAMGEKELGDTYSKMASEERKERFEIQKSLEPEVLKIQDRLQENEIKDAQLSRMEELNATSDKTFPGALKAALVEKGGIFESAALPSLSPEAQEYVKLVANQLNGIKNTLGAQISGFEVNQFMKQFPKLSNTKEGREMILGQLKLINRINRELDEKVLDLLKNDPTGKMTLSKAKDQVRDEYAPRLKMFKKVFADPKGFNMKEPPDPSFAEGLRIEDPEGFSYISNGKEWIPEGDFARDWDNGDLPESFAYMNPEEFSNEKLFEDLHPDFFNIGK
ncbi:MAG: hypothetical protein KGI50_05270 [Patescibacteria group bacterium]|nr:hypothetical protein [Patescibacteria group bacterium]MDE2438730.1 hypothetical protein [Patescibacteria group bacterium]